MIRTIPESLGVLIAKALLGGSWCLDILNMLNMGAVGIRNMAIAFQHNNSIIRGVEEHSYSF